MGKDSQCVLKMIAPFSIAQACETSSRGSRRASSSKASARSGSS